MIEISDLHKKFGKLVVLNGLDLEISSGGIFAILGPNGSGKTTLIKLNAQPNRPMTPTTVNTDPIITTKGRNNPENVRNEMIRNTMINKNIKGEVTF